METQTKNNNLIIKRIGQTPYSSVKTGKSYTITLGNQIVTGKKFKTRKEAEDYILNIHGLDVILTTVIEIIPKIEEILKTSKK